MTPDGQWRPDREAVARIIDPRPFDMISARMDAVRRFQRRQAARAKADAILNLAPTTNQWRDIASAPKDGTQFLAYEDGAYYALAWNPEEGFWCSDCGQPVVRTPEPTHWMPRPKAPLPPTSSTGGKGNE